MELSEEYDSYGEHTHFAFWAFVDGQGIGGVINKVGRWRKDLFHAAGRISATEQFRRKLKFSSITKGTLYRVTSVHSYQSLDRRS